MKPLDQAFFRNILGPLALRCHIDSSKQPGEDSFNRGGIDARLWQVLGL